jgi:cbb3-type cytochrome oxidase subunit 3
MKELFASPELGLIGLLFFFAFFCIVTLWTFRPGAKKTYKTYGDIPLEETKE